MAVHVSIRLLKSGYTLRKCVAERERDGGARERTKNKEAEKDREEREGGREGGRESTSEDCITYACLCVSTILYMYTSKLTCVCGAHCE